MAFFRASGLISTPNPLPAADVLEEEAATAAEIQHVVGLRDVGRELGQVRPASDSPIGRCQSK